MRLDVLRRPAVIAVLLVACAAGISGQERPVEFDNYIFPGWSFTPGLALSGMWDSNTTLQAPDPLTGRTPGDNVFVIVPSGDIALNSSRTTFSAGYRGYLRRHIDLGELDGFDQRAYVSLQRTATPRLSWFVSNEFAQLPIRGSLHASRGHHESSRRRPQGAIDEADRPGFPLRQ
jgi:hypothetical protein